MTLTDALKQVLTGSGANNLHSVEHLNFPLAVITNTSEVRVLVKPAESALAAAVTVKDAAPCFSDFVAEQPSAKSAK